MIQIHDVYLPLDYRAEDIPRAAADKLGVPAKSLRNVSLLRRSLDARKKKLHFTATVTAETDNEAALLKKLPQNIVSPYSEALYALPTPSVKAKAAKPPVVVGFGPAGIFAALTLAQAGLAPVVLERGRECVQRVKSVEEFQKSGTLDPESNVQFGEGGAGAFSDGKLTTGIRDLRIRHIFRTLTQFGAPPEIMYLAKPHIGTDVLRTVVRNIRAEIIRLGGRVVFGARLTDLGVTDGRVTSAIYEKDGETSEIFTDSVILAIGHSARDTFELLRQRGVEMEQKSFAMGVRIEHLQSEVDRSMYGGSAGHPALSAADYKFALHLPNGRTLYTFCMCPGGYVIGAASEAGGVVTNGMSCHARDGRNANAALLVNTTPADFGSGDVLAGVELQRKIERAAFAAGGGDYRAPCSLVGDFLEGHVSAAFSEVRPTYLPGTSFALPDEYLPAFICETMREGLPLLAKKADFFGARDALLTGAETRSSSPVRILRGETLCSRSVKGLYPCGEGAGYAGGIVSAAVDGIKCAEGVIER